jgi:hypothetical protein
MTTPLPIPVSIEESGAGDKSFSYGQDAATAMATTMTDNNGLRVDANGDM